MTGIELITAERQRQISVEGWTPEHDDQHKDGELARAGAWYALNADSHNWTDVLGVRAQRLFADAYYGWPFDLGWFKPKNQIRDLVKAGALIAAEIDRIQRKG